MMDNKLSKKYCDRFGCNMALVFQTGIWTLKNAEGKLFDMDDLEDEELNTLMQESLDKGENILLERVKDKEYTFELSRTAIIKSTE